MYIIIWYYVLYIIYVYCIYIYIYNTFLYNVWSYICIFTHSHLFTHTYSSREWELKTNSSSRTVVGLFVWDLSCHGPTEVLLGNRVQHILWYLYICPIKFEAVGPIARQWRTVQLDHLSGRSFTSPPCKWTSHDFEDVKPSNFIQLLGAPNHLSHTLLMMISNVGYV